MATNYPSTSLYVDNLHPDVTEAILFDIFINVGSISSINVCRDMITQEPLGYAYVNFQNAADAEYAIQTMNSILLYGRPLRIMWSQHDPDLHRSNGGNVFVKNLDKNIDNKLLYDTFSAFGNILSCKIMRDENGQSKGFAFLSFENSDEAEEAIQNLNGYSIGDKQVHVGRFQMKNKHLSEAECKKDLQNQGVTLFIKNLDDTIDDERLKTEFSKFGTITSATVMKENGRSKGFGFVCFSAPDDATKAITEMNGSVIESKSIYVGLAQRKEGRCMHLTNKHMENNKKQ